MSDTTIIPIQDSFDIIEARVQVRGLARSLGFDLFDQARISLAASTLAYILGLGREAGGQITVEQCWNDDRSGVRVICLRSSPLHHEIPSDVLDDARRMVDDLAIDQLPDGETRITLTKWPGRASHRPSEAVDGNTLPRHIML